MRKKDILCLLIVAGIFIFIAAPATREIIIAFTAAHPYLGGFLKFAVLATMGELLAQRIVAGAWLRPRGLVYRMLLWGFLGMVITLIFTVFAAGVKEAMTRGLLPGEGNMWAAAFLTSLVMNLAFAPTLMLFHRLADSYIDLRYKKAGRASLSELIKSVDWPEFFSFVIFKTIPFFWLPAHTVTFLLLPQYRVLMAAALSFALGLILAYAKIKSKKTAAS